MLYTRKTMPPEERLTGYNAGLLRPGDRVFFDAPYDNSENEPLERGWYTFSSIVFSALPESPAEVRIGLEGRTERFPLARFTRYKLTDGSER